MFLEGMFFVMVGIIVSSFAAFVQINAFKKRAKRRILPMDKFDLPPSITPLQEVVEHSDIAKDFGTVQYRGVQYQGAALQNMTQRQRNVRNV
jgi:hypothetical protein